MTQVHWLVGQLGVLTAERRDNLLPLFQPTESPRGSWPCCRFQHLEALQGLGSLCHTTLSDILLRNGLGRETVSYVALQVE